MQRDSIDALEIGREKQLLDYTMLNKMPNGLKMQIATVILESHKINAMAADDSDKLDHTTTKYTETPAVHRLRRSGPKPL